MKKFANIKLCAEGKFSHFIEIISFLSYRSVVRRGKYVICVSRKKNFLFPLNVLRRLDNFPSGFGWGKLRSFRDDFKQKVTVENVVKCIALKIELKWKKWSVKIEKTRVQIAVSMLSEKCFFFLFILYEKAKKREFIVIEIKPPRSLCEMERLKKVQITIESGHEVSETFHTIRVVVSCEAFNNFLIKSFFKTIPLENLKRLKRAWCIN